MATSVETLNFSSNGIENFFNELEVEVQASITASGVYKLDQNSESIFTNATLVTEVEDGAEFVEEEGRAYVRDADDVTTALYVKFVI